MRRTVAIFLIGCVFLAACTRAGQPGDDLLQMVEEICSNPQVAYSSNAHDYINAKREVFDRIVARGDEAVQIFVAAMRTSETFGLDKFIMALACAEITGVGKRPGPESPAGWTTAREWLALYEKSLQGAARVKLRGDKEGVLEFLALLETLAGQGQLPGGECTYETCFHVTPAVIAGRFAGRIFKCSDTFASYLMYEGRVYLLGHYFGGVGVMDIKLCDLNQDGQPELLYTYSFGSGVHRSMIGHFDPVSRRETMPGYVYWNHDMMLIQNEDGSFSLYHADITLQRPAGMDLVAGPRLADIVYIDGEITVVEGQAAPGVGF
jgi:hypothetical protein